MNKEKRDRVRAANAEGCQDPDDMEDLLDYCDELEAAMGTAAVESVKSLTLAAAHERIVEMEAARECVVCGGAVMPPMKCAGCLNRSGMPWPVKGSNKPRLQRAFDLHIASRGLPEARRKLMDAIESMTANPITWPEWAAPEPTPRGADRLGVQEGGTMTPAPRPAILRDIEDFAYTLDGRHLDRAIFVITPDESKQLRRYFGQRPGAEMVVSDLQHHMIFNGVVLEVRP